MSFLSSYPLSVPSTAYVWRVLAIYPLRGEKGSKKHHQPLSLKETLLCSVILYFLIILQREGKRFWKISRQSPAPNTISASLNSSQLIFVYNGLHSSRREFLHFTQHCSRFSCPFSQGSFSSSSSFFLIWTFRSAILAYYSLCYIEWIWRAVLPFLFMVSKAGLWKEIRGESSEILHTNIVHGHEWYSWEFLLNCNAKVAWDGCRH